MSKVSENKEFINKAKKLFHEKGYEVKQSELYEIFSQLAGYKDWNTAVAKNAPLAKTIVDYVSEKKDLSVESFLDHVRDTIINEEKKEEQLLIKNPNMSAWNYSIVGDTGSGKSVFLNKFIYSYFKQAQEPKLYVLTCDLYNFNVEKMSKDLNLKVIKLGQDLPRINLFDIDLNFALPNKEKTIQIIEKLLEDDNNTLRPEHLFLKVEEYFFHRSVGIDKKELQIKIFKGYKYLDEILELQIGESIPNKEQMTTICNVLEEIIKDKNLEESVYHMYETVVANKKRLPVFLDFKFHFGKKMSDESLSFIAKFPLFDSKTEVDFNQSLVVDFKALEINPKLKIIYTLLFEEKIRNAVQAEPKKDKMVVRDDLDFRNCKNEACLINSLRTSRKNNCVTVTLSQSPWIVDWEYSAEKCSAVLSNINKFFIFRVGSVQARGIISSIYRLEPLYPNCTDKMKSLGVLKDGAIKYSSFAVLQGASFQIYENRLNNEELSVYIKS